ncbi:hypothetical protein [Glaciimonas sp. PCH181]|uniref:hypothetical protein n=1 Tax=Glaciimonas sp. PCH181 TaxID=2133943 RepID=UPI000D38BB25|nr:hypothetical protein [Glaciimonas sp. PCH181]PUA19586.1 hypothetical protein C7W93_07000 [Glaciimonas sp. PCH181]
MAKKPQAVEAESLPVRITMAERAFYEIGTSGVHRDLIAGDVITDPVVIAEVIAFGASWY